ncbi:PAS domain S-box protein [Sphaerospermopsis sp. FACHB-1194]|uniref:PAS domain S-box protein n=1 Tax=Sphaerospermopsis sp. FACHB-1194 TaxID=2692862 RepID=UPI00168012FC|nr:PAS domain S-box protein [Sphaerospermopsis sp. FACHB-1194]MBD2148156.1 PAS domain S-box protein [Sphaerospermopsis sp. FACHB-1194]
MVQPRTVLIVDDSPEDRQVYRRYLQQDQEYIYTIFEEELGQEALALCRQFQPDGILLDFLLPDLNGLEFITELKQQTQGNIPAVIMLTGYGNEAVAVQAIKSGVQDYLVKGKTTAELLCSTVNSAIKNVNLSQELQRSEERFRTSVENMLDCFGIYSAIRNQNGEIIDFRIDYVNAAACECHRLTKEEIIDKRLCEILPAYRTSGIFNEYCRVIETGNPVMKESQQFIYSHSQKQLARYFDFRIAKMKDGCVVSWRDVTEKKQAEERLRQSEAQFRRIVESNIVGIYFGDIGGQIYEANDAFLKILGYTREEFANGSIRWDMMTPSEYKNLDQQKIQELQTLGICTPFEKQYFHKNGSRIPVLLAIALIEGEKNGYSVCFVLDLTQHKQTEEALRQSEQSYRYLSDAIPQLVWIANTQGECVHVNQRWLDFTGQTLEQVIGSGWTKIVHPDDIPIVMEAWLTALQTGKPYEFEKRLRRYDGVYRWYLVRAVPIKDEWGRVVKWFGTSTDIEDSKQLEAERIRLLEMEKAARLEAEQANQAKDDFVAMVSHDLRSPLNAILGWANLLRTRPLDTHTINRALEIIERNAHSQAKLLEDLLNISRILRGKLQLEVSQVNLVSIVNTAIETAYPTAKAENIFLESVIAESIPPIRGDAHRLLQVLGNLIANAIKFTPSGGRVKVKLSLVDDQVTKLKYTQITVSDTGIGISPEFLPFVFERYHQCDGLSSTIGERNHKKGGLGLGLAIARHLVELHGGTIEASSPGVDKGATFTIKLPISS